MLLRAYKQFPLAFTQQSQHPNRSRTPNNFAQFQSRAVIMVYILVKMRNKWTHVFFFCNDGLITGARELYNHSNVFPLG